MKKIFIQIIVFQLFFLISCGSDKVSQKVNGSPNTPERQASNSSKRLFEAINNNDVKKLEELLKEGVSLDVSNSEGHSPLACALGKKEIYDLLLKYMEEEERKREEKLSKKIVEEEEKAKLDGKYLSLKTITDMQKLNEFLIKGQPINLREGFNGYTILHYAVEADTPNIELIKYLIEHFTTEDVNAKTSYLYKTALKIALEKSVNIDIVKLLLVKTTFDEIEASEDYLTEAYLSYKKTGNMECFAAILNKISDISKFFKDGSSIIKNFLVSILQNKQIELIFKIIEVGISRGVNIDFGYLENSSFLYWAVYNDYQELALKLIEKGANVDADWPDETTPLIYAISYKKADELIEKMIDMSKDVNKKDKHNLTALYYLLTNNNLGLALKLIEKGADVDADWPVGTTPLIYAISTRKADELIEKMISKTKDVNKKDKHNLTALYYAIAKNDPNLVAKLIEKKADVDAGGSGGITLLIYALKTHKNKEILELLINESKDLDKADDLGMPAISHSLINIRITGGKYDKDDLDIIYLLINRGVNLNIAWKEDGNDSYTVLTYILRKKIDIFNLIYLGEKVSRERLEKLDLNFPDLNGRKPLSFVKNDNFKEELAAMQALNQDTTILEINEMVAKKLIELGAKT